MSSTKTMTRTKSTTSPLYSPATYLFTCSIESLAGYHTDKNREHPLLPVRIDEIHRRAHLVQFLRTDIRAVGESKEMRVQLPRRSCSVNGSLWCV